MPEPEEWHQLKYHPAFEWFIGRVQWSIDTLESEILERGCNGPKGPSYEEATMALYFLQSILRIEPEYKEKSDG